MICQKEANPIRKNAVKQFVQQHSFYVGVSGLEPEKAGPESAVLPLHHIPNIIGLIPNPHAKVRTLFETAKFYVHFLENIFRRSCFQTLFKGFQDGISAKTYTFAANTYK